MIDPAVLDRLAESLPENGEPSYADRIAVRRELDAESLLRLEESCARRVFPVWEAMFTGDEQPVRVMEAALAARSGLARELGELRVHLDSAFDRGDEAFAAIYAGNACWAVARDAVGDVTEVPEGDGELEVDPAEWSPCFYASIAEAGGAVWEEGVGDNEKRRAFWRWYLLEAVPAAQAG
ncbi:Imm5 family immunity protein [Amycolatopsis sp. GM8]|uniref:Imm5 family immunity protein n=1 Tax=Amycolatopsis sp. GM8 TaxID=2896530 RepID=UPI001EEDD789|nr:Imm5 family immunity protein [Amycolatopsis sp. GM8]